MATLVEKYVVTGGANGNGDLATPWSTMDNARAGLEALYPSGLPTADVQVDLYVSGATQDTAPTSSTGVNWSIITDATRYIRIIANTGQRAHMQFDTGIYRLVQTNGFRPCMTVATQKLIVNGLQFRNTGSRANNPRCISVTGTTGRETYIYNCYGDFTAVDAAGTDAVVFQLTLATTHKLVIRNCVGRGGYYGMRRNGVASGAVTIVDNCTFYGNTVGMNIVRGVGTTFTARNNVCAANTTDFTTSSSGGTLVTSGNRSSDATSPDAAGQSQTFTFVDAAGGDLHLAAGDVGAQGAGTDLSADADNPFSDDQEGDARSAPWDSGADQYVAAGPTYYDLNGVVLTGPYSAGGGGGRPGFGGGLFE